MIDFIVKYWIEFLFGGIIGILSYFIKHYYNLWKESKDTQTNNMWDNIRKEIQEDNKVLLQEKEELLNSEDKKLNEAIKEVRESNAALLKAVLDV